MTDKVKIISCLAINKKFLPTSDLVYFSEKQIGSEISKFLCVERKLI